MSSWCGVHGSMHISSFNFEALAPMAVQPVRGYEEK